MRLTYLLLDETVRTRRVTDVTVQSKYAAWER